MPEPKLRINWTVPAPVIIALIAQAVLLGAAIATWKTSIEGTIELYRQESKQRAVLLESRLGVLEQNAANNVSIVERVKGVEVNMEVLKEQNVRIENKLDKVVDREGRK